MNDMNTAIIEKNLKKYLPKGADVVSKAMRYSVFSGGKRLRPLIALEACRACGGKVEDAIPAACAIEFIHTYSLIHDDLPAMDDDDVRRGRASCHKAFGEANAILAGDALLTLAFKVIARYIEPKAASRIICELADASGFEGMVLGQALDIGKGRIRGNKGKEGEDGQRGNKGKEGEDGQRGNTGKKRNVRGDKVTPPLSRINLLKTARLFEAAAKCGALAAGAGAKKTAALSIFGLCFGMAFQAVDDELDGEAKDRREAYKWIEKAKSQLRVFGRRSSSLEKISDMAVRRAA